MDAVGVGASKNAFSVTVAIESPCLLPPPENMRTREWRDLGLPSLSRCFLGGELDWEPEGELGGDM